MQKPGPHEFVLGNRAVWLSLIGAGCFATYESATAGISWLCPILLFLVGHRAAKARAKVSEYRTWTGAWDKVAGHPQRPARNLSGLRPLTRVLGLALWGLILAWLYGHASEADTANFRYVGASFLALTVLGARRLWRALPSRAAGTGRPAERSGKDGPIVTTPLAVPGRSPSPAEIARDLPDYARALILMPQRKEQQP